MNSELTYIVPLSLSFSVVIQQGCVTYVRAGGETQTEILSIVLLYLILHSKIKSTAVHQQFPN